MTSNVLANDMQLRKVASSISNCANRIRSGVELDQVFGSKWLLSCIPWVSQFHTTRLLCSNSPCCTKVYRGKIASDNCETAQTMLIPTLPPSMNPAHCIGWVLSAGQGPNQMFQKLGLDGGPGLRSLISLIKRDQNCYACNTCAAILIDCLIRTHSKDESLMTSVYYSDLLCKSK